MRVHKIFSSSVIILLITVLFACAVTAPAAAQYDTMQFHYNAAHTGDYSPVAGPVPSNGQLKWKYATGSSVFSSPAVANGVVYVGSYDGNLYAINANNGTKLWSYTLGASVIGPGPAVADGVVYIGSGDWNVYALYANNGTKLWNFATTSGMLDSPAVANGVVYVGCSDGNVYAIYANNGTKLWNHLTGSAITYSSPAVANGVVYYGSNNDNVTALYANNGSVLWNYTTGSYIQSSPAVANGVVYVGSMYPDCNVYALNATSGAKVWSFKTGSAVGSSPAVANGVVYVGSSDGNVYALNANNGNKLCNFQTGSYVFSSPAVANGVVYVGNGGGTFYALNATTGVQAWSFKTGSFVLSSPAVVNGVVYMGSGDNNVYALGTIPTTLTATVSTTTAYINQKFTINGTLRADTNGIAGATIQLQKNVSGTWQNVAGKTNTTTATGAYGISTSESAVRTYQYRTVYAGNATYANAISNTVSVTVKLPPPLNGPPITGAPAATYDGANVWLVAQGATVPTGNIYYKEAPIAGLSAAAWSAPLGTGTNPTIVALGVNRVDIFWRSSSGALAGRTTANGGATWTAITLLPSQVAAGTGPAATYNPFNGQVDVFYVNSGSNSLMWDSRPANVNNMQQNLGGIVTATPGVVAPTTSSIDVFVRGTDGALYEKVYATGGFGSWTKFHDGVLAAGTGPTAASAAAPDIYLFVQGTDGHMYMVYSIDNGLTRVTINQQTGAGSTRALYWLNLGGVLTSSPSGFGNIAVLARGGNGHILENDGSAPYTAYTDWTGWYDASAGP